MGTLAAWRGVDLVRRLEGGVRNEVFLARRGSRHLVVRRSNRAVDALQWEIELVEHLRSHGITVPVPIPTDDGRKHVNGVLLYQFIEGDHPRCAQDWRRVVEVLDAIHSLTVGWRQRPGFASSNELLRSVRGGDVRLDRMPVEAVKAVRKAWCPILIGPECVVHGDVGSGNVLVNDETVALLDWDEARVDVPWFDFSSLPEDVEVDVPVMREQLNTAGIAWEAATCWVPEPDYAATRLSELYSRLR